MKKLIIIAFILLSKAWTANAQQLNSTHQDITAASGITASSINLKTSVNWPVKNALWLNPDTIPVLDKASYMKKSRTNRIASYCLMGGGAIVMGIGALSFPKDYDIIFGNSSEKENKADAATALVGVGAAVMLSSIPFTVMASVNKRKANAMVASQKTGSGVVPPGFGKNIAGITMTIPIGK